MEQRDIEILLTLADELHFGRAAARLHVSTARVSQTIKKWERRVGGPLFERTSRRVDLTPVGRRLCDELRPAYQRIQDAVDTASAVSRGRLRVGFVGAASGRFVLEVAEAFRAQHPHCEVTLHENHFGEGLGPLRGGDVDLVLATLPAFGARQPGLTAGAVLVEEEQLLAVAAGHPSAARASISVDDVARHVVLRTPPSIPAFWDQALIPTHTSDGRPVERGPTFDTTHEMLALVGAGIGTYPVSTQFTTHYQRPDVAYVPIHDAAPYQRRLFWLGTAETGRTRDFDRAAAALAAVTR